MILVMVSLDIQLASPWYMQFNLSMPVTLGPAFSEQCNWD